MDMTTTCAVDSPEIPDIAARALAEALNPLDAAVAAFRDYAPEERRLAAAHADAEVLTRDLARKYGKREVIGGNAGYTIHPPFAPEYSAALEAEAAADDLWQDALDNVDELAQAILDAPVTSVADAQRKQELYAQLDGGRFSTKFPMEEDQTAAALDAARVDLDALTSPDRPVHRSAWSVAFQRYTTANQAVINACAAHNAALRALEEQVGKAIEVKGQSFFSEEGLATCAKLTIEEKFEALGPLRAWVTRREALRQEHRLDELEADLDERNGILAQAQADLLATPAPDIAAIESKVRLLVEHVLNDEEVENPDNIAMMLTTSESLEEVKACDLALIFQDLLRLTKSNSPALRATAWNVEAWVERFEALPKHEVSLYGGVCYDGPEAWGPDCPTRDDLTITDPEVLRSYREYLRGRCPDYEADREKMFGPNHWLLGAHIEAESQIEDACRNHPEERERLLALWRKQREMMSGPPLGAPMWAALKGWQKQLVRDFAKARGRRSS